MHHIPKPIDSDAPRNFKRWLESHQNARYSNLHNSQIKSELKNSLVIRQSYLCCYCETRIFEDTSHIEHIEPQFGGESTKTLLYSNMAASCIKDPQKKDGKPQFVKESIVHCGHARGTNEVVSPYESICDRLFEYSFSGEIKPNSKLKNKDEKMLAINSIGYLRLNVPSLMVSRKIAMVEAIKLFQAGVPEEKIFGKLDNKLIPFWSAAKFAVEKLKQRKQSKLNLKQ
ncbi:MAG: TIGR02646 family protein [Verrucomicrobiaceae bacterium]|nr:TIGR02646 family protein [Verrucomicrobiaceae bacterium]